MIDRRGIYIYSEKEQKRKKKKKLLEKIFQFDQGVINDIYPLQSGFTLLLMTFLKALERVLHRADTLHRQHHSRFSRITYSAINARLIRVRVGILTGWLNVESHFFCLEVLSQTVQIFFSL